MSKKYRTPYGLPVRYYQESGTHIENEFLFGLYEEMFCGVKSAAVHNYYKEVAAKRYPNHIDPKVPEKDISHDQLTAYSAYSYMNNLNGHVYIWCKMDGLEYEGRMQHPRDAIYYALLNRQFWAYCALPLFYLMCAISFIVAYRVTKDEIDRPDQVYRWGKWIVRQKLSGELLWILRYESLQSNRWAAPLRYIIKKGAELRYGNVYSMVATYFQNDINHPIIKNWNYQL